MMGKALTGELFYLGTGLVIALRLQFLLYHIFSFIRQVYFHVKKDKYFSSGRKQSQIFGSAL